MTSDAPDPSATPPVLGSAVLDRHRPRQTRIVAVALLAAGTGVLAGMRLGGGRLGRPAAPATASHADDMQAMPGMSHGPAAPPAAAAHAVYIAPARQQLIGVRSAPIGRQRVEGTIRTVGTLAYDETRSAQVHTRVSGWVERLHVDYVGKQVVRGEPLFEVYSPDLATAQGDYLVALRARQRLTDSAGAELRAGADAVLAASRDRLRRWDVTDAQIAELETADRPPRSVAIASPFDGVVVAKDAFAGQYVTPEMTSFKLADLSTVWAIGQVFEYEAARLRIGDAVDVEFPYGQAGKRAAKIEFIYPDVDPQTRRVRFRATLDNRDRKLKPDTYVSLVWRGDATERLVIPREAVIDTGTRKYALLALADGYFAARDVQVGAAVGDVYPVISGIAEGERVVVSAQFLVDSETNLMAAMQAMSMTMPGMDMGGMDMTSTDMAGMDMSGMDMSGMDHSHHHTGSAAGGRAPASAAPGHASPP